MRFASLNFAGEIKREREIGARKATYEYPHILQILVQAFVLLGGGLGYLRLRAPDLLKQLPVTLELGRSPWYHLAIERESISCLETEKGAIFYLILNQELLSP